MKNSSCVPAEIKIGIFYSQAIRVFRICTSLAALENELHSIIEAFIQNNFHFGQLERTLTQFMVQNFTQFKKFGIYTKHEAIKWLISFIKKYK